MCHELIVWPSTERSTVIETQGQLTAFIGGGLLYVDGTPNGARNDDKGCLCWVDLEALGKRAGFEVEYDGMFYYWKDHPDQKAKRGRKGNE